VSGHDWGLVGKGFDAQDKTMAEAFKFTSKRTFSIPELTREAFEEACVFFLFLNESINSTLNGLLVQITHTHIDTTATPVSGAPTSAPTNLHYKSRSVNYSFSWKNFDPSHMIRGVRPVFFTAVLQRQQYFNSCFEI
jgi:hypothetical protein